MLLSQTLVNQMEGENIIRRIFAYAVVSIFSGQRFSVLIVFLKVYYECVFFCMINKSPNKKREKEKKKEKEKEKERKEKKKPK